MTTHRYLVLVPARGVSAHYPEDITIGDTAVSLRRLPDVMADAHRFAGMQFCHIAWPPNTEVDDRVRAYLQSRVRTAHPGGRDSCPAIRLRFGVHPTA